MLGAILRFLGRWVLGYLIVFVGTVLIWQVLGVVDRDGGKGMALAFFIAPVLGLFITLVWPLVGISIDSGRRPEKPQRKEKDS